MGTGTGKGRVHMELITLGLINNKKTPGILFPEAQSTNIP
jgi:hypothetical protein